MREWTPSEKRRLPSLHRFFGESLGDMLITDLSAAPLDTKPLDLTCRPPLPPHLRLYLFNCTDHPSERRAGDYRIQLRLPGQERRQRGQLARAPGALLVLAGFVVEFDVFVLWDANAHQDFPYSKGVQVAASTVHHAAIHGLAEQQRDVRGNGYREWVVAVRADRLTEGVRRREELSRQALLGDSPSQPASSGEEAI
ncbi:hypothetical protein [Micromonospora sicca]|uniref:hypothetical protein n=1 Tax=Micromonospora sicca TaxID=2202420 RepID=UPI0011B81B84|nr:hypothetical protein [Micromonospora sp. 4G51]